MSILQKVEQLNHSIVSTNQSLAQQRARHDMLKEQAEKEIANINSTFGLNLSLDGGIEALKAQLSELISSETARLEEVVSFNGVVLQAISDGDFAKAESLLSKGGNSSKEVVGSLADTALPKKVVASKVVEEDTFVTKGASFDLEGEVVSPKVVEEDVIVEEENEVTLPSAESIPPVSDAPTTGVSGVEGVSFDLGEDDDDLSLTPKTSPVKPATAFTLGDDDEDEDFPVLTKGHSVLDDDDDLVRDSKPSHNPSEVFKQATSIVNKELESRFGGQDDLQGAEVAPARTVKATAFNLDDDD